MVDPCRPHAAGWIAESVRPQLGHENGGQGRRLAGTEADREHATRRLGVRWQTRLGHDVGHHQTQLHFHAGAGTEIRH